MTDGPKWPTQPVERLLAGLPPAGSRALANLLEELERNAKSGHGVPEEVEITLRLDRATGRVKAVVVPHEYR